MKVPKPPCRVNNQDCPDRHVYCHSECEKYIEFEKDKKVYDAFVKKQKQKYREQRAYEIENYNRYYKK